jgi:hypothetical protein
MFRWHFFAHIFFNTRNLRFYRLGEEKIALFRERKNLFFLRVSMQNANFSPHSEWVRISESPSPHSFLYIYRLNIHAGMDVFVMELRNVCSAETALIRFTK